MRDRFMRGLSAGVISGAAASLVNILFVYVLGLGQLVFWDFAGVLILGRVPKGLGEHVFAELGHLGFSGGMGVLFAYLRFAISDGYLLVKGIFFGLAIWFIAYSAVVLFNVPEVAEVSLATAATDNLASAVYGLVLACLLRRLDKGVTPAASG